MLSTDLQIKILNLKKNYSIYATWSDPELFKKICEDLASSFSNKKIDKVLGLEARGFVLGSVVAYILNCGFVVARKKGKLYQDYTNKEFLSEDVSDYSGKPKSLEIEINPFGIQKGENILIIDDWFETGGQVHSAIKLVERRGATVTGLGVMLDDMSPEVRGSLSAYDLKACVVKDMFVRDSEVGYRLK